MKDRLQKIRNEAIAQIKAAGGMDALNDIRVSFLGKKGELTAIMKSMRDIPPEERPAFGQMVNEARQEIENSLDTMKKDLAAKARELQLKSEVIDVTLPAKKNHLGHRHPNSIAQEEVERIFTGMGYEVVEGPEIEFDYYNFEALNIILPKMNRIHSTSPRICCFVHRHPVHRSIPWKLSRCRSV